MSEKIQATGSIWNPNSWHWEEKDYTQIARQVIKEKIESLSLEVNGIKFTNTCKEVKGDAQICVRKGKQILNYDIDVEVEWKAENETDEAEGTYKLKDLTAIDDDFEIINLQAKSKTAISDQSKQIIQKQLFPQIKQTFKNLVQDLATYQYDPERIKQELEKRKQVAEEVKRVQQETGQEKERLLQEQKLKDQQLKEQFYQQTKQQQNV